ncbi:hypothetical protein NIES592_13115 [Fischerella major NIES-592]|uniref:ParG n=1 Tax=Fischerella major NIES-592 TaxID=210994 RepID=A0A1U7GYS0_9CYAN|nr:hypothetical protein NIES592_13115 [Fischerella major NIES-592]
MHISIPDDLKRQFHSTCAFRGLKMSQVVTELIEQWLKINDASTSDFEAGEFVNTEPVTKP